MKIFLFVIFIVSLPVLGGTGRTAAFKPPTVATAVVGSSKASDNDIIEATMSNGSRNSQSGNSLSNAIEDFHAGEANKCQTSTQICSASDLPLPSETLDMAVALSNLSRGKTKMRAESEVQDCGCLRNELLKGKTATKLDEEMVAERKRVNDKILETFGRKFINSFSMNLEDASFFSLTPKMFTDPAIPAKLQCRDAREYNQAIDNICASRNITDKEFIKKRKDLFINAINPRGASFDTGLDIMGRDILSMKVTTSLESEDGNDHSNSDGKPKTEDVVYVRDNYDRFRLGLSHNSPKAIVVNTLLTQLLRKDTFAKEINNGMIGASLPFDSLVNVIKKNRDNKEFRDLVGIGQENLQKYFGNEEEIKRSLSFMMNSHPGVMYALQDKTIFSNLAQSVKRSPELDMINRLENDPTVLQPIIQNNCSNMISEFANAVCTTDDNLISRVDPKDLERLLHQDKPQGKKNGKIAVEPHELLICMDKDRPTQDSEMIADLSTFISKGSSDYLNRIAPALIGGRTSGFAAIAVMASRNVGVTSGLTSSGPRPGSLLHQLNTYTDAGNKIAPSNPIPGMLSQQVHAEAILNGRVIGGGSQEMSRSQAEKIIANNRAFEQKTGSKIAQNNESGATSSAQETSKTAPEGKPVNNQVNSQLAGNPNYITPPSLSNVASTANSKQSAQAREQLRQYLADKNDPGVASKAVSSLDDASTVELNRLRNEKQNLLEQELKDGEARLKDLRTQLSNAASKVQTPVPDRNIASVDDEQKFDEDANSSTSSGRNPRSIDQRSAIGGGSIGGGQVSSNAGAASTGSKSSAVVSNNVPKAVADTEAQVTNSPNAQSDATGSLVITAADVKASGTLPAQELNQEVQKFLASSNLSSASIQDIKSNGIKIRFNVMENNKLVQKEVVVKYDSLDQETRNQIDLKLARNNVKNQISKLAVLKLLISSSANR